MDWQTAFSTVCSVAIAAVSLWVKSVRDELTSMKKSQESLTTNLSSLREMIPQRYATVDDVRKSVDRVMDTLNRIEAKLDNKADKK